jgi:hypothetical protein
MQALKTTTVVKPNGTIELQNTEFAPGTAVEVIVLADRPAKTRKVSFLRKARKIKVDGPADWSINLDEYLYGDKNGKK